MAGCSSEEEAADLRSQLEAGALRAVDCPGLGQDAAPVRTLLSSRAVESAHPALPEYLEDSTHGVDMLQHNSRAASHVSSSARLEHVCMRARVLGSTSVDARPQ